MVRRLASLLLLVFTLPLGAAPTFRVAVPGTPEGLDPAKRTGTLFLPLDLALHDALVAYDPVTGLGVPGLAASWQASDYGRTWTFDLRGAQWSDGSPLEAADVVAAWYRTGRPGVFSAPSARTLVAVFPDPVPSPAVFATGPWMVWTGDPAKTSGPFRSPTPGPGPAWSLEKNPFYRGASQVLLGRLVFQWTADDATADELFRQGGADWAVHGWGPGTLGPRTGSRAVTAPAWGLVSVRVNPGRPGLADPGLPAALGAVLDRNALVQGLRGPVLVAGPFLVPGTPNPPTPRTSARMKAPPAPTLPPGLPAVTLTHPVGETYRRLAEGLAAAWGAQGLRVEPKQVTAAAAARDRQSGNYDLLLGAWTGDWPDPTAFTVGLPGADQLVPLAWYASVNLINTKKWKGWSPNPSDAHPWTGLGPR